VSLIGHTGVGKSTLCSQLTSESPGEESSTFGKKVWTWTLDDDSDIEKRVILHDHGGQSAVMRTFLPFLFDSDVVLFLFKKKDRSTLTKSLKALEELEDTATNESKVVFVETFIDDPMDDARAESKMAKLKKAKRITAYRKVSPLTGENIPQLRKLILKLVEWDNAKTMIELESVTQLRLIIDDLRRKKIARISLKKLLNKYEDEYDSSIPQQHLKFLLSNLSNEGVIEYYPDKLDAIIINDKELNWLRTEIPITAEEHGGIISIENLKEEFRDQPKYIDILDDVYRKYGFSIQIGELRIFPELLDEKPLTIPSQIKSAFEIDQSNESLVFRPVKNLQFSLIERLSDLNLSCIDAKKREGLFGWRNNGILYYNFSSILDPSEGEKLKVNWTIGGKKLESRTKLRVDFEQVLWDVLGEPLDSKIHTLIRDGESKETEFKASLRYDYVKSETNEDLEYEVIRTIAGFLNTKGGDLIIGVKDDKVVIGLKKDYTTLARGKKNRDGYRIRLTQLIDTFFPSEVLNLIDFEFKVVRGKEVCWIKIHEAKGPVFVRIPESRKKLRKQEAKQFFRRTDSGTKRLDIEESTKYIEDKWSEK
jgi:GTPase SAR1 family protein